MAKHVRWCFNATKWIPTKDQWLKLSASVPICEMERINKFVYKEDAKVSLIGQVLIRSFLSISLKRPSNQLDLTRNNHGRPVFTQEYSDYINTNIDFNVSHSGDYCVLVGYHNDKGSNVMVGADVTQIIKKKSKHELDRFLDLMSRREFSENEWSNVALASNDQEKCLQFTRLWCLKECFIKAIGLGLAYDLKRIEFDLVEHSISDKLSNSTRVKVDGCYSPEWQFLETQIDQDHLVAIGYHCNEDLHDLDLNTNFVHIEMSDLMDSLTPIQAEDDDMNWVKFIQKHSKTTVR